MKSASVQHYFRSCLDYSHPFALVELVVVAAGAAHGEGLEGELRFCRQKNGGRRMFFRREFGEPVGNERGLDLGFEFLELTAGMDAEGVDVLS